MTFSIKKRLIASNLFNIYYRQRMVFPIQNSLNCGA